MPSNTPETQAILPVTAEDVEAALATFDGGLVRQNDERNARGYTTFYHPKDSMRAVLEEFSARQSSSNAGGVDPKRIEDCINAAIGHGEHGIFVDVAKATESILASLSTPTTEPDPDDRAQNKAGGLWYRRWHDAQTRVNELESMLVNPPEPTGDSLRPGLERAAQWHDARCKGPDVFEQELHENSAKALRHLAANPDATDMQALEAALTTPPTPHEFVKNPLIPFPSCQVCMGPENAEAHSPPTPDRIGKDAVREALERVLDGLNRRIDAACQNDEPVPVFDGIAALHDALSASPAQPVDETERLRRALREIADDPYKHGQRVQKMKAIARAALQHKWEASRG